MIGLSRLVEEIVNLKYALQNAPTGAFFLALVFRLSLVG